MLLPGELLLWQILVLPVEVMMLGLGQHGRLLQCEGGHPAPADQAWTSGN